MSPSNRDTTDNRELHPGQYTLPELLFLPLVTSVRGLYQAGTREEVREKLRVAPHPASFSEAAGVLDPGRAAEHNIAARRRQ